MHTPGPSPHAMYHHYPWNSHHLHRPPQVHSNHLKYSKQSAVYFLNPQGPNYKRDNHCLPIKIIHININSTPPDLDPISNSTESSNVNFRQTPARRRAHPSLFNDVTMTAAKNATVTDSFGCYFDRLWRHVSWLGYCSLALCCETITTSMITGKYIQIESQDGYEWYTADTFQQLWPIFCHHTYIYTKWTLTFRNPASYKKDGHTATLNTPHFLYFFNKYTYWIFLNMLHTLQFFLFKMPFIS
jgi:hypothetical protein